MYFERSASPTIGSFLAAIWQLPGNMLAANWQLPGSFLAANWQLPGNRLAAGLKRHRLGLGGGRPSIAEDTVAEAAGVASSRPRALGGIAG
jgi:hypothetical protein